MQGSSAFSFTITTVNASLTGIANRVGTASVISGNTAMQSISTGVKTAAGLVSTSNITTSSAAINAGVSIAVAP